MSGDGPTSQQNDESQMNFSPDSPGDKAYIIPLPPITLSQVPHLNLLPPQLPQHVPPPPPPVLQQNWIPAVQAPPLRTRAQFQEGLLQEHVTIIEPHVIGK